MTSQWICHYIYNVFIVYSVIKPRCASTVTQGTMNTETSAEIQSTSHVIVKDDLPHNEANQSTQLSNNLASKPISLEIEPQSTASLENSTKETHSEVQSEQTLNTVEPTQEGHMHYLTNKINEVNQGQRSRSQSSSPYVSSLESSVEQDKDGHAYGLKESPDDGSRKHKLITVKDK